MVTKTWVLGILVLGVGFPVSIAVASSASSSMSDTLLGVHNAYREDVGVPSLEWSLSLAVDA